MALKSLYAENTDMTNENDKPPRGAKVSRLGIGIGAGIALGVAIGAAIDNIPIGIAIGIAIGAAIGAGIDQQRKDKDE